MTRFLNVVTELYTGVAPKTVLEVGCGEGLLAHHLVTAADRPARFHACDLSLDSVLPDLDRLIEFREASIYKLPYPDDSFDLVICCEVLEHLERPTQALAELRRVASRAVLISTPWEPVWRMLNILRGRYLRALGNTPGHVQNFSRRGLRRLASRELNVEAERRPLPWTVILGRPRK